MVGVRVSLKLEAKACWEVFREGWNGRFYIRGRIIRLDG